MKKRTVIFSTLLILLAVLAGLFLFERQFAAERKREAVGPVTDPVTVAEVIKYTCGMHPFVVKDKPGNCPICGMELTPIKEGTDKEAAKTTGERKIKYWAAPMDPTYIRNEPGKSPMGMDLVPVYEDAASSGSTIRIDPVISQNMGVRTALVTRRHLHRTIRTVGLVSYDEPRQYLINSKINGWIEKLYVNETGRQVKKGQPLLNIYSPDLVSAQNEFLLAFRNKTKFEKSGFAETAESGRRLLESSRRRLKLWDISDGQIKHLEKTGTVQKTMTLYSPYDGIVSMKMAFEGMYAKAGMELFQISDISKVWVYADIYEYELPWVKVGQEAEIILPFIGEKHLKAKVAYLYPYVEPKTRTVKARFELENPDFDLKPDMYVNIRLKAQEIHDALAIPAEAVLYSGEKKTVFIALGDGKFEPRPVKIGMQDEDGYVHVAQGLLEGEKVVTSAQFMFDSESKLREAIQKMLEPKTTPTQEAHEHAGGEKMEDLFTDDKEKLDDLFK